MVDAFTRAEASGNISHHQRTIYWIKELEPNANEALLIAGMLHDIERAFNGDWKAGSQDPEKLRKHQELARPREMTDWCMGDNKVIKHSRSPQ